MTTISAKINKKELNTIQEYANAWGETVSNLIRKVLISEDTFMNWSRDSHEYDYGISYSNTYNYGDNFFISSENSESLKTGVAKISRFSSTCS